MSAEPLVSCCCATYNRGHRMHLLSECVYWFTRQEYASKELIILNDTPGQVYVCSVPGVRVFNVPRIDTLGRKRNMMLELAEGDIILPWDDDDISLPHRIRQSVDALDGFHYYNPGGYFFENRGKLGHTHGIGVGHNCSAFWKGALRYDDRATGNEDFIADQTAKMLCECNTRSIPKAEWSYVYRWGVSDRHISGFSNMQAAWNADVKPKPGLYNIVPRMYTDYVKACADALTTGSTANERV